MFFETFSESPKWNDNKHLRCAYIKNEQPFIKCLIVFFCVKLENKFYTNKHDFVGLHVRVLWYVLSQLIAHINEYPRHYMKEKT